MNNSENVIKYIKVKLCGFLRTFIYHLSLQHLSRAKKKIIIKYRNGFSSRSRFDRVIHKVHAISMHARWSFAVKRAGSFGKPRKFIEHYITMTYTFVVYQTESV